MPTALLDTNAVSDLMRDHRRTGSRPSSRGLERVKNAMERFFTRSRFEST